MKIEHMKVINKGSIKAFFSVDLVKLKINNCKLVQQDGQSAWFSGPDESFTAKDGTKKYKKHVTFVDKDLESKVLALAVEEYRKHSPSEAPASAPTADDDIPF